LSESGPALEARGPQVGRSSFQAGRPAAGGWRARWHRARRSSPALSPSAVQAGGRDALLLRWPRGDQPPNTSHRCSRGLPRHRRRPSRFARESWSGSFSTLTVSSTLPPSVMRTITDRRLCRSIPTYCRCCSTGVSFRRFRVVLETPSVPCTLGSRRREGLRRFAGVCADLSITTSSLRSAPGPAPRGAQSRGSVALLHDISCLCALTRTERRVGSG